MFLNRNRNARANELGIYFGVMPKDHRPDLKQAVWALMVAQDGGVPCVRKSWDGHTSDTQVVPRRAEALLGALKDTPTAHDLVADATLSCADHAVHRAKMGFLTRIPATRKVVLAGHAPSAPVGYLAVL